MKKSFKVILIIALVLVIAGSACSLTALISVGFNLRELSTNKPAVKQTAEFGITGDNDMEITTKFSDLSILPSADEKIHIQYYSSNVYDFNIENENNDGVIHISEYEKSGRPWYNNLSFSTYSREIKLVVELPEAYKGNIIINCGNSAASIHGVDINGTLTLNAYEEISVVDSTAKEIYLCSESGETSVNNINTTDKIQIEASFSDIVMGNIDCGTIISCSTNDASIRHNGLIKAKEVDFHTSDGTISLGKIDAQKAIIKANEGSVSGTSVGSNDDYTVFANAGFYSKEINTGVVNGSRVLNLYAGESALDWGFTE